MQPLGRKKVAFPGKTKEWLGKGVRMWWEVVTKTGKKTARQADKREIARDSAIPS